MTFLNSSLTFALILSCATALAQQIEQTPTSFLANKPLNVELTLPQSGKITHAQLLPGGPHVTHVETHPADILASVSANQWRYTSLASKGISANHLTDSKQAARHFGNQDETHSALAVNNTYLLAATQAGQVHLFDLASESGSPLGTYEAHTAITQIALLGQRGYLLGENGALMVVDLKNPEWPVLAGEYTDAPETTQFALRDNLLYLAAGNQGLLVLDITNAQSPMLVSRYKTNYPVQAVALQDDIALLVSGLGGLTVLDNADPKNLVWLGSHSKLGYAQHVVANELAQAVVLNSAKTVFHIDFSLTSQPTILSSFQADNAAQHMALSQQELSIYGGKQSSLWDLSAEQPLLTNENLNMGEGVNFGGQRKGFVQEDILYVADWFSGIHIYDIRQRNNPRLLASHHTPGSPKGVVVKDNIAYIADDDHGLQLVDVRKPSNPQLISSLQTNGLAYTPVIDGNLLYLASHRGGFQIIDISNAFEPVLVGEYDTPSKAWSITVKDNIAYVADAESGLLIFDVSAPSAPQLIGQFDPKGNAEDVLIEGNLAYVAFFDQGVYVLDISDPKQPAVLSHLTTPGNARGLDKQGFVLYVADWLRGVHAINVANPEHPKLIGSYDTQGAAWGVKIRDSYAYAFDWWGGLTVVDVGFPSDMREAGNYNQRTPINQLRAKGNYMFAAQGNRGLQTYDIKNPLNPTWVTGAETQGKLVDLSIVENFAFAVAEEGGLAVFDITNAFQPKLLGQFASLEPLQAIKTTSQRALTLDRTGAIIGYDISRPRQTQQVFQLNISASDFQASESTLLATQGNKLLSYSLSESKPTLTSTLIFKQPLKKVRLDQATAYVVDQTNALHIVTLDNDQLTLAKSIALPQEASDLLIDGKLLHILDKKTGVSTFVMENQLLRQITHYPLTSHINQLYAYRNQLYGIGEDFILAINKVPDFTITAGSQSGKLHLAIPTGLPTGAYDIIVELDGKTQRLPNAITTTYYHLPSPPVTPSAEQANSAPEGTAP